MLGMRGKSHGKWGAICLAQSEEAGGRVQKSKCQYIHSGHSLLGENFKREEMCHLREILLIIEGWKREMHFYRLFKIRTKRKHLEDGRWCILSTSRPVKPKDKIW